MNGLRPSLAEHSGGGGAAGGGGSRAAAFVPFAPVDFSTPGEGFNVLPCPAKLPHDLQVGQKLARRFGEGYNNWYVGKITEVNRRRTKQENVSVEFEDEQFGTTWGHFLTSADGHGADRLWVVPHRA